MSPTKPVLTPRSRAARIAGGRARFNALKQARIARMRDAADDEAAVSTLILAASSDGSDASDAYCSEDTASEAESAASDTEGGYRETPRRSGGARRRSIDRGSRGGTTPVADAAPAAEVVAELARERALRVEAEEARRHAEEERTHAEGLLTLAREEHAEAQLQSSEQLHSVQTTLTTQQAELEHFRARAAALQEEQAAILNKMQVKRKRIAAADRSLELLRADLERAAIK